jgi:hypothetical protein
VKQAKFVCSIAFQCWLIFGKQVVFQHTSRFEQAISYIKIFIVLEQIVFRLAHNEQVVYFALSGLRFDTEKKACVGENQFVFVHFIEQLAVHSIRLVKAFQSVRMVVMWLVFRN